MKETLKRISKLMQQADRLSQIIEDQLIVINKMERQIKKYNGIVQNRNLGECERNKKSYTTADDNAKI
ncbi:MAG: hypothetical protein PVI90_05780 [Desulfobacteraceae bacterium]|jgi:hypothetical protein